MKLFWESHNPCNASSRQYLSAIFFQNDEQKKLALETRDAEAAKRQAKIATAIVPLSKFYLAEGYHQKYALRNRPDFNKEFQAIYPDEKKFVDSTAVARVNSYLDGHGKLEDLEKEIASYGLSPEGSKNLLEMVKKKTR